MPQNLAFVWLFFAALYLAQTYLSHVSMNYNTYDEAEDANGRMVLNKAKKQFGDNLRLLHSMVWSMSYIVFTTGIVMTLIYLVKG